MRRLTLGIALAGIAAALGLLGRASLTAAGPDDRLEEAKLIFQNEVEGRTMLLRLVPNGKRVKKGELLAELDSAALRDRLVDQEIRAVKARADLSNASKTREVAEIVLREYQEGTYPREMDQFKGEVAVAESALKLADERLQVAQQETIPNPLRSKQSELDRDRARMELQKAKRALDVLRDFTYPAALARLQADLEKSQADRQMKEAIYQLEKSREHRLVNQINRCQITSPVAGKVIHSRSDSGDEVKEGTILRERGEVLRLIPDRDGEKP